MIENIFSSIMAGYAPEMHNGREKGTFYQCLIQHC